MRNADGRYPLAGVDPNPVIVEVAAFTPRSKSPQPQVHRSSSTRKKFVKGEIIWDCSGGLPDQTLYNKVLGEYRTRYSVHAVALYFPQEDFLSLNTGGAFRHALRVNGFVRDETRNFWIDFPLTPDPGNMIAFVCYEPHQWRDEPIKRESQQKPDTRSAEEKLAEAEEFAHELEVAQKRDALAQRAWAAAMERGQI